MSPWYTVYEYTGWGLFGLLRLDDTHIQIHFAVFYLSWNELLHNVCLTLKKKTTCWKTREVERVKKNLLSHRHGKVDTNALYTCVKIHRERSQVGIRIKERVGWWWWWRGKLSKGGCWCKRRGIYWWMCLCMLCTLYPARVPPTHTYIQTHNMLCSSSVWAKP